MLHHKDESYIHLLPLKKWFDWISKKREKNVTTSNVYILRKGTQKLENILFLHIMTTFHNFADNKTSWAETVVTPILENRNIYAWFIKS